MFLGKKRLTLNLALITSLLLSSATVAAAQDKRATTTTGDWSRLNSVAIGSKLTVKLKTGKVSEGKLASVSNTALSLTVKGKAAELERDEVLSVHEITRKSTTKATLIGLGVGAGAGAAIGAVGDASNNDGGFEKIDNVAVAGLTVLGAAAGALTGYLIGKGGSKRVLIYEAR